MSARHPMLPGPTREIIQRLHAVNAISSTITRADNIHIGMNWIS